MRPELSLEERSEIARKIAATATEELPEAQAFGAPAEGVEAAAAGYRFDDSLLLGGDDRFQTAMVASWYSGLGDEDGDGEIDADEVAAPVVYVVDGMNFPDALSAAAPAAHNGGVLLMTKTDTLPGSTKFELERLHPEKVVLVGGTAAISEQVAGQIGDLTGAVVERRAGANRYETARAVIETAYPDGPLSSFVYLASGVNFPDALAAGAPAALFGVPIVLIDGRKDTIDAETLAFLDHLGVTGAEIAGGTAAISTGIQAQLEEIYGTDGQVLRSSGATRYETAAALVEAAHGFVYDDTRADADPSNDFPVFEAYFASGRDFPDALSGGAIAGYWAEPFYPLDERCGVAPAVADSLAHLEPSYSIFLGDQSTELHRGVVEDGVLAVC